MRPVGRESDRVTLSRPGIGLRVAIVGSGMIADSHLRGARAAGATAAGVLGSAPERSLAAAERLGLDRGYASLEELLADDVDVVHICTPNDTHADFATEALEAGVHVVCEKPLAVNAAQAEQLAAAAKRAELVATVPFVYRFHALVREMRARRERGDFGRTVLVHGSYLQDWLSSPNATSWRVDSAVGGSSRAFADIGSHWCDLAEFVSGERITEVSATTRIVYDNRPAPAGVSFGGDIENPDSERLTVTTEDIAIVTFRTANGVVGNTVISQVSAGRKNRLWLEVDGEAGSAVFDQEDPERLWFGRESDSMLITRGEPNATQDQARFNRVPAGHPQGYADAFDAFVSDTYAAVRGTVHDGLPTFADGLRSNRIIDAVLASAASGGTWTPIIE